MASLMPGTYFLSANAKPWYATHPISEPIEFRLGAAGCRPKF